MARQRPRSEVVVAVGLVAFIAIAFVKPWGSPPRQAVAVPSAAPTAAVAQTATPAPTPDPVAAAVAGTIGEFVSVPVPPVGLVADEGDIWLPADVGRLLRIDPRTGDVTWHTLDPKRFSEPLVLAGDGASMWVAGADDKSVGLFDTSRLDVVDPIEPNPSDLMVIDKVNGAAADGGRLWFYADVHASQEILGTPCCNGFTDTMLYQANAGPGSMIQVHQLRDPLAIGAGLAWVWVLRRPDGSDTQVVIDRLDHTGTVVSTIALPAIGSGFSPCGACITSFFVGSNSLWVPTGLGQSLLRVDPEAGRVVATIDLGREVGSVTETPDGYIWVAGGGGSAGACDPSVGYVARIDPSTNRIHGAVSVPCPVSLTVVDGNVWVGTDGPAGPTLDAAGPTLDRVDMAP